jgi:hypothetical protein
VTKCPSMALSRSALSNLESSYALFESVSHNPRVAKVLVCFFVKMTERVLIDPVVAGSGKARQESCCVDGGVPVQEISSPEVDRRKCGHKGG